MYRCSRQPQVEFKKQRRKPRAIESGLQQRIVALWGNIAKNKDAVDSLVSSQNGANVSYAHRRRLIAEGMKPGMPDLTLYLDPPLCYQHFELKRPKTYKWSETSQKMIIDDRGGYLSDDQKHMFAVFEKKGRPVLKIDSEQQFIDWVKQNARDMLKCQS